MAHYILDKYTSNKAFKIRTYLSWASNFKAVFPLEVRAKFESKPV